ncbi:HTTM domain-containing protein [Anoxybacillus kestanbolensis]|uniref:HTTM domain-containing protein n=1 Tax=Anoxybacillus kestanbolensis TaxID=227476 RepID=UPI003D25C606
MQNKIKTIYDQITKKKHFLIGSSILRIAIGIHVLFSYFVYFTKRHEIWGPNSYFPMNYIHENSIFTLYSLSDSLVYFEIIYFLGIIINFLYMIGFHTKITGILNYIWVLSLYNRNYLVLDGGNNILIIILFFLMFADVSAHFSITERKRSANNEILNMLHNFAIYLCLFQVCVLYFFSGFAKSQGHMWFHGTALYYILNISEFTQPILAKFIINSPLLLTLGAYSAILLQIFFPLLVFNKYSKIPILVGSICFHLSIILVMGLVQFGLIMIALDLLFVSDKQYQKAYQFIKKFKKRRRERNEKEIVKQTAS